MGYRGKPKNNVLQRVFTRRLVNYRDQDLCYQVTTQILICLFFGQVAELVDAKVKKTFGQYPCGFDSRLDRKWRNKAGCSLMLKYGAKDSDIGANPIISINISYGHNGK